MPAKLTTPRKTAPAAATTGGGKMDRTLKAEDFARLFGVTAKDLPAACLRLIEKYDFRYRVLQGAERDAALLEALEKVDSGQLSLAGPKGKERWDVGWGENLDLLVRNNFDLAQLIPRYIRPGRPLRLDQEYIATHDPDFELHWFEVFRTWLFHTYMKDAAKVVEFGSGSGFNLAALATMFPRKELHGTDWADPSVQILNKLGEHYGWNLRGHSLDFFKPDPKLTFPAGAVVYTIGALEQTNDRYEAFLEYVLKVKPALCVNIEPIVEWYDRTNLVDYMAIRFHTVRKYWTGFNARLEALQKQGKVQIFKTKRSFFGSQFIEGYSQTIWKPL